RYLGLTFSPDSERIYYVARTAGDEPGTLYRIAVVGGSPQRVKDIIDSPISFSPDGKKFVFMRETDHESQLIIAELDSGREQILISRKLPDVLDYPAWSPDGRVIVCSAYDSAIANSTGSNVKIIEVRVADRTERILSKQTWGTIKKIAWLGNGRGLIMSARDPEESGLLHLWYVFYPDGIGRKITEGLYWETEASASADSRHIITVQHTTISSIWRAGILRGQNPELVASGKSGSSAP